MKAWLLIVTRLDGSLYSTVCVDGELAIGDTREFIESEVAGAILKGYKVRVFELEIPKPAGLTIKEIV